MYMETRRKQLEAAARAERIRIAAGKINDGKLLAIESQVKTWKRKQDIGK